MMVIASAGALLATSPPDRGGAYQFEATSEGQRTTLTAAKPQARYLVRARVTALGPEGVDTTSSAAATVHGTISATSSEGSSPFVRARFGASGQMSDAVTALVSFQLSRPLRFMGNCVDLEQSPACQTELELELALEQPSLLTAEESVNISWSVDFESRFFKPSGKDGNESLAAPWTIEIVELTTP